MKKIFIIMVCAPVFLNAQSVDSSVWDHKVTDIISETARPSPVFTGGSVTLTNAGLATSVIIMSLEISKQKEKDVARKQTIQTAIDQLRLKLDSLNAGAFNDLHAFDAYRKALKLPDSTEALKQTKRKAKHDALLIATFSPLNASDLINRELRICGGVTTFCHYSVISDMGAGSGELRAASLAMLLLVKVNCVDLEKEEKANFLRSVRKNQTTADTLYQTVSNVVENRIDQHK